MKYQFIMTYNVYRDNQIVFGDIVYLKTSSEFMSIDIQAELERIASHGLQENDVIADFHITRIAGE